MIPQMGLLDAIGSGSFAELKNLMDNGQISEVQGDIFTTPRLGEELYDCNRDPRQLDNVVASPDYGKSLTHLRSILSEWMKVTGDDIPNQLTKDWYLMTPGNNKTSHHGIRGEMPGSQTKAVLNNNKGRF